MPEEGLGSVFHDASTASNCPVRARVSSTLGSTSSICTSAPTLRNWSCSSRAYWRRRPLVVGTRRWNDSFTPFLSRMPDRKSTRLNSSHPSNSYAVFCLKNKQPESGNGCADELLGAYYLH